MDDPDRVFVSDSGTSSNFNPEPDPLSMVTVFASWEPRRLYPHLFRDKSKKSIATQERISSFYRSVISMTAPMDIVRELLAANCRLAGPHKNCPFEDLHESLAIQFLDKEKALSLMAKNGTDGIGVIPGDDPELNFYVRITPNLQVQPPDMGKIMKKEALGSLQLAKNKGKKVCKKAVADTVKLKAPKKLNFDSKSGSEMGSPGELAGLQHPCNERGSQSRPRRPTRIVDHGRPRRNRSVNVNIQDEHSQVRRSIRPTFGRKNAVPWWVLQP